MSPSVGFSYGIPQVWAVGDPTSRTALVLETSLVLFCLHLPTKVPLQKKQPQYNTKESVAISPKLETCDKARVLPCNSVPLLVHMSSKAVCFHFTSLWVIPCMRIPSAYTRLADYIVYSSTLTCRHAPPKRRRTPI
jgi:hypothetical protein